MAALGVTLPTLLDIARALGPDNKVAPIIEILNETNEVLDDMVWLEGNLVTGHQATLRTGIPTPTWRKFNQGVQPTKSTTVATTFNTGMLRAFSEVDKDLADLNGNTAAYRLSQDRPHLEGMSQEVADTLFFGNEGTEPEAFTGLSRYYNDTTAASGGNIILGGSADTDNTSIYLVVWGEGKIHGIYPKGSTAGLKHKDMGEQILQDASDGSNTGRMIVYASQYSWDAGLAVSDWRYCVRIANIEKSALTKDAATGPDLPDLMYQAIEMIPSLNSGKAAFYMSRNTRSFVRRQCTNLTKNSTLAIENVGGKPLMTFQGIPLRRCDPLAADEALVA